MWNRVHGPSDKYKEDCAQFVNVDWGIVKDMLKNIYVEFKIYHMTTQQDLDRRKHLDATISSNLSEHPLYGMTPRYRMRTYLRQKLGFGLRDRSVRSRYGEMYKKTERHLDMLRGEVESVRMSKGKNLALHKDSITPKEMADWSKEPMRLRQLPTLFVTLIQTAYKVDVNEWTHAEEKHFERGGT